MIEIELSEREFDYEIQALVQEFFPGRRIVVYVAGEQKSNEAEIKVTLHFSVEKIKLSVEMNHQIYEEEQEVAAGGDYHKTPGKTANPYRTYYKNIVKKMIYMMLKNMSEEELPDGFVKRVPEWGTLTGVRPTKVTMNELLQGKPIEDIRKTLREEYCLEEDKIDLSLAIAGKEAKLLNALSGKDSVNDNENIERNGKDGYSIYVGIPFCPTTCLYCSFTSYPYGKFGALTEKYLEALMTEIREMAPYFKGRRLSTVYIGGGTPTTLSGEQLKQLITCLKENYPIDDAVEFTVEAGRPDSITEEKLQALKECGVERISVNPQTMQQKTLDLIGRRHTVEQTAEAFEMARKVGFANINMDLIVGLPEETEEDFKDTLRQIKELNPDSLTVHSLVVKRASKLRELRDEEDGSREIEYANATRMENMLSLANAFAKENGYIPYYMYRQKNSAGHSGSTGQENIGFARDGKECIYNILIMEEKQTILAFGAGASTKVYHSDLDQVSRVENVKSLHDYIGRTSEMIKRKVDADGLFGEYQTE